MLTIMKLARGGGRNNKKRGGRRSQSAAGREGKDGEPAEGGPGAPAEADRKADDWQEPHHDAAHERDDMAAPEDEIAQLVPTPFCVAAYGFSEQVVKAVEVAGEGARRRGLQARVGGGMQKGAPAEDKSGVDPPIAERPRKRGPVRARGERISRSPVARERVSRSPLARAFAFPVFGDDIPLRRPPRPSGRTWR